MESCRQVVAELLKYSSYEELRDEDKSDLCISLQNVVKEPQDDGVRRLDGSAMTPCDWYKHFQKHLVLNLPCVFPSEFTASWPCRKDWVTDDGQPCWDFLIRMFGSATVPVAHCKLKYYNSQQKTDMKFTSYIEYWQSVIKSNYDYDKHDNLYLKDWHFVRDFPNYYPYETPLCFKSDWLNEFWTKRSNAYDDYRFVYMGPKGSWTPLHADVFNSYSWSANICGLKKWIMFAPEEEDNLKDKWGKLAYDVTLPEIDDSNVFPKYHKVCHRVEILQKAGQVVFVPSRWFHQVYNLEDTISINHNWFNGFNIHLIWRSMMDTLSKVQHEIEDCKEMDGWHTQCQLILKSVFGMDVTEFCQLIRLIGKSRLADTVTVPQIHSVQTIIIQDFEVDSSSKEKAIEDATIIFDLTRLRWAIRNIQLNFPSLMVDFCLEEIVRDIDTFLKEKKIQ